MAQIEFHPPADWVEMEAPSKMPPQVIYLKKVKSPDEVIQITVIATYRFFRCPKRKDICQALCMA